MPELPETHTIASILDQNIKGLKILKVAVAKNYKALPQTDTFIKTVAGKKIKSAKRVAKNILIELENGNHVLFHLAMTGRLLLWKNEPINERGVRVILYLEGSSLLTFSDVRMFGKAAVLSHRQVQKLEHSYGPDPFNEKLTGRDLIKMFAGRKTGVKNVLLDQKIIAGLGNIYANEALFLAGINPKTKASLINEKQAEKLCESIRRVLEEGIKFGGSTLEDKMYVDPYRKEGKYQEHFKIYSQNKCPRCGENVVFLKMSGRGTYFCPNCQPEQQ
ncbi:MAG: formamidopyrimidine-DNA glycosylase [Patescibacteria group bacterium]|nr:MAG: formamidopyrimidine-DNA glycosylase [Patescibacteria group bacterium]